MALTRTGRPPEAVVADGGLGTAVDTPRRDGEASSRGGSLGTVCALVLVLVAGLVGSGELHDNSFLTHLATGRWITNGNLGRLWMGVRDPYLWTSNGRTWVVQSWLASVVYDAADRVAGAAGIRLLVAATSMALTACLWRLSAPGRTLVPRVIAVGGALAIGGTVWSERPLMFGLLFLAMSLLAADGAMRTTWLVPVGWLWVNTHGSFPLGLVALGTLALGTRLDGECFARELRAMRDLAVGCILGGVLSPVGPVLLTFPLSLLRRQDVLGNVQEWKSTDFTQSWARVFLVLVALGIVTVVRRPGYRRAIPLAVFALAGAMAARNVAVASVVLVPVLARGLEGIGSLTESRSPTTRLATIVLLLLTPLLVVSNAASGDYRLSAYPVSAVDWLDARGLLDGSVHVAEEDFVGNYLEWRYGGGVPAFIDDRYDLHDEALVRDYLRLVHGDPGWNDVLDQRAVDVIVWRRESQLGELLELSGEWQLAYDSTADAATGRGERNAPSDGEATVYVVYCRATVAQCFELAPTR